MEKAKVLFYSRDIYLGDKGVAPETRLSSFSFLLTVSQFKTRPLL